MEKIILNPPVQTKRNLTILLVMAIILMSAYFTNLNPILILLNITEGSEILIRMFIPRNIEYFTYFNRVIGPMLQTIQMAIVGTVLGAVIAIPFAVLAASNMNSNRYFTVVLRFILNIFRTIPPLLLAAVFVAIFGIGAFSGVLAIFIFTFGLISKLTYESIESIDPGQVEALIGLGANKMNILRYAVIPQVLPQYLSYTIYGFEINIRAAAVLGYVGAGGIGQLLQINLDYRNFDRVGLLIIVTFVVVLIIDFISSYIRGKLV